MAFGDVIIVSATWLGITPTRRGGTTRPDERSPSHYANIVTTITNPKLKLLTLARARVGCARIHNI